MSEPSLPARVWRRLQKKWYRWHFQRVARHVHLLPPLRRGGLPFVMLSMVHTRDVDAYLIAAHSFAREVPPDRVVVVCDPSITDADRETLRASIPHIELVQAEDFRHPQLPVGGCWERLQAMARFAQDAYVVQLDADTVCAGPLPEVVSAIRSQTAFTMADELASRRVSFAEARQIAAPWQRPGVHIQGLAEFVMVEAHLSGKWYARGCAGFFSLPAGNAYLQEALEFSNEMRRLTGDRWVEWGSEQVTANYLAANCSRFRLLPWPRYATPAPAAPKPVFAHFIGTMRHTSSAYRIAAASALHTCGHARDEDAR